VAETTEQPESKLTGVVLAGGRSTRFGEGDKALADLAGTPMIRRVADRLTPAVADLVVNCRPEQTPRLRTALEDYPLEVSYAEDEEPDRGPTAGIRNGLRAVNSEYAFVVACDMPFVDPALVEYLFERASGHDAAVPRCDDGWYEPIHAVYAADAMADACTSALRADDSRILIAIEEIDAVIVSESEIREVASPTVFENVNTEAERAAAVERIQAGE
jgi:molybdopterin-guanine dinucleotide biosynthesis protein A